MNKIEILDEAMLKSISGGLANSGCYKPKPVCKPKCKPECQPQPTPKPIPVRPARTHLLNF